MHSVSMRGIHIMDTVAVPRCVLGRSHAKWKLSHCQEGCPGGAQDSKRASQRLAGSDWRCFRAGEGPERKGSWSPEQRQRALEGWGPSRWAHSALTRQLTICLRASWVVVPLAASEPYESMSARVAAYRPAGARGGHTHVSCYSVGCLFHHALSAPHSDGAAACAGCSWAAAGTEQAALLAGAARVPCAGPSPRPRGAPPAPPSLPVSGCSTT